MVVRVFKSFFYLFGFLLFSLCDLAPNGRIILFFSIESIQNLLHFLHTTQTDYILADLSFEWMSTQIICGHKVILFLQIGLQMTAYSIWHSQQKVLGIQGSIILGILSQFYWSKSPPPPNISDFILEASERQVLFVFRKGAILTKGHSFLSPCAW